MSYPVSNVIPLTTILTPAGISAANFNTAFIFATQADLAATVTFENDTYRDYAGLDEILEDFAAGSVPDLIARRWFAVIPSPPQISVYMWNDDATTGDSPAEVAAKATDAAWRYWLLFPQSVTDTEADVTALADFCDANTHHASFTLSSAAVVDPQDDTDLASVLQARGNRRIFIGYRKPETVSADASQAYANAAVCAVFQKFNPDADRSAITAEYQVLSGVVGESLTTTEYNALKAKNVVFWTEVELQGGTDPSRTINTRSMSSFGEFIDDVVNVDVLANRLKVARYNYIANAGTKRGLTARGHAGLLNATEGVLKQFYNNGALGRVTYTDPRTGEEAEAKFGYVVFTQAEDVLNLSAAERTEREYPPTNVRVFLARAGHTAPIDVTVE